MTISVPQVTPQQVFELVSELDTKGFACIPNYVQPSDLTRMQSFVSDAIRNAGNEYVHFNGPDAVAGSGLEELAHSEDFNRLIYDLYEQGTGNPADKEEFYQVLRCLSGSTGQKNSLIFHYDSYVVTALIPIHIPADGLAGDLLMYPNTRTIRSTYIANAFDKVLLDNPITQKLLRNRVSARHLQPMRIKMKPGNIYFFWGYRSIHTNEPCDPDKIRATALFHYKNPHRKHVQ
ncbi:MAG: hypothetical protein HIU91_05985 [Acidobacteria bacterium]|nr:hypothetical protein [Acidobacteriota bacterium]